MTYAVMIFKLQPDGEYFNVETGAALEIDLNGSPEGEIVGMVADGGFLTVVLRYPSQTPNIRGFGS